MSKTVKWIGVARLVGLIFVAFAMILIAISLFRWRSGGAPPDATIAGPALVLCLGLILLDAVRLIRRGFALNGFLFAGWALLSLAVVSAAAVAGALSWNPRIAIAWVFSGAFFLAGATTYFFATRRTPRRLVSARQARDEADSRMTGGVEWRDGALPEEAVRNRLLRPAAMWFAIAAPFFLATLIFTSAFFTFAAVPSAIGALLLLFRWNGDRRVRKFGVSVFHGRGFPLGGGDRVVGRIIIPKPPPSAPVDLSLRCILIKRDTGGRTRSGRRREGSGMKLDVLHREDAKVALASGAPGVVEVDFRLPAVVRNASPPSLLWKLEAKAAAPGLDYKAEFLLPVRR